MWQIVFVPASTMFRQIRLVQTIHVTFQSYHGQGFTESLGFFLRGIPILNYKRFMEPEHVQNKQAPLPCHLPALLIHHASVFPGKHFNERHIDSGIQQWHQHYLAQGQDCSECKCRHRAEQKGGQDRSGRRRSPRTRQRLRLIARC
jgi:hypothetical protein